jgi:hypothetical protein
MDRYELQGELVSALRETEFHRHLVPKVEACHKSFRGRRHQVPGCGAVWAKGIDSCSLTRLCPHCAHYRALVKSASVQKFMLTRKEGSLRYAVLSERNSANLEEGIASLWTAWTRLRRSVHWKRKVQGSTVVLEVTYNRASRTWHPHLNVLMEGEYFPFELLNKLWIAATHGNGRGSFIKAADQGTALELVKYTLKVAERAEDENGELNLRLILDRPEAIDEYLSATYNVRLIRTYGTHFGQLAEEDEEEKGEHCPDCGGSDSIVDLGPIAPNQLVFDFEKDVFRIRNGHKLPAIREHPGDESALNIRYLKGLEYGDETLGEQCKRRDREELSQRLRWIDQQKKFAGSLKDKNEGRAQAIQTRKKHSAYERRICAHLRAA